MRAESARPFSSSQRKSWKRGLRGYRMSSMKPFSFFPIEPLPAKIEHFVFRSQNKIGRAFVLDFLDLDCVDDFHVMNRRLATGQIVANCRHAARSAGPPLPMRIKPRGKYDDGDNPH